MRKILLAASLLAFATAPALAQMVADVKFQPGNYGTMVSGTVKGDEYFDYKLGAKAGQEMFVELNVDGRRSVVAAKSVGPKIDSFTSVKVLEVLDDGSLLVEPS
jgi:nucleoside-specific outer membrane channel protein Tsx